MLRLPNFFMLCIIRLPSWKLPLVLPLPIFLVDEILDALEQWGRFFLFRNKGLSRILGGLREAWRGVRMVGAYTLLEVRTKDGVHVAFKFL